MLVLLEHACRIRACGKFEWIRAHWHAIVRFCARLQRSSLRRVPVGSSMLTWIHARSPAILRHRVCLRAIAWAHVYACSHGIAFARVGEGSNMLVWSTVWWRGFKHVGMQRHVITQTCVRSREFLRDGARLCVDAKSENAETVSQSSFALACRHGFVHARVDSRVGAHARVMGASIAVRASAEIPLKCMLPCMLACFHAFAQGCAPCRGFLHAGVVSCTFLRVREESCSANARRRAQPRQSACTCKR